MCPVCIVQKLLAVGEGVVVVVVVVVEEEVMKLVVVLAGQFY